MRSLRIAAALLLAATIGVGCEQKEGSNVGPQLLALPAGDYRVLVRDEAGRPVVGALVLVDEIGAAATGSRGRALLRSVFGGERRLIVAGGAGSATATSELGTLTLRAPAPASRSRGELPFTVYLPDTQGVPGVVAATRTALPATTIDDSAGSGAIFEVAAGETVSFRSETMVTLKAARLSAVHLPPGILRDVRGSDVPYSTDGVYLSPPDAEFDVGVTISLPNVLGLPDGSTAALMQLDPITGSWTEIGRGEVGQGRIRSVGAIKSGGLYCFATFSAESTVLTGRVVDKDRNPLAGVHVRAANATTTTDTDGRFELPAIARQTIGGAAGVSVVFDAGRDLDPVRFVLNASLTAARSDLGDVEVDTFGVGTVRTLLIARGEGIPNLRFAISNALAPFGATSVADNQAGALFEDVPFGVIGYDVTRVKTGGVLERLRGTFSVGRSIIETILVGQPAAWRTPRLSTTAIRAVDDQGGGPVNNVHVVVGDRFAGTTLSNGLVRALVDPSEPVTLVHQSEVDGRRVTSALSVLGADLGEMGIPVTRARRTGSFGRYGLLKGRVLGAGGTGTQRRVRTTGRIGAQDWVEAVFSRERALPVRPRRIDPAVTGGDQFLIGAAPVAHLVATEGAVQNGVFDWQRLGLTLDVTVPEGRQTDRDLSLPISVDRNHLARGAFGNRDNAIPVDSFRFDLGAQFINGLAMDVVRGVGGNHTVLGSDVTLRLPELPTSARRWLVSLSGQAATTPAGTTAEQQSLLFLDSEDQAVASMLPLPAVSSPAPGATLARSDFVVKMTIPAEAHYAVLTLRSENPDDLRVWRAVLPQSTTEYRFFALDDLPDPILAGREWTLELSAYRINHGALVGLTDADIYLRVLANFVALRDFDRGVGARSTVRFTVGS